MKVAFRIVLGVGILLVVLIAVVGIGGALLPRTHHVTRSALYAQPPDSIWAVIADMEHSPSWRSDITGVKRLPDHDGHPVWLQIAKEGNWPLEITVEEAPSLLVAVVADSSAGFGGAWTYHLVSEGTGTRVTITEDGFVSNPFFRFIARYCFGLTSSLDAYLTALGHHFRESVHPVTIAPV